MPDACINCGNCSSLQAFTQLRNNCPVLLFNSAFDDTAPNVGDEIFDPTACIRCGNCVDYWNNNINGGCPGDIWIKIAPASQPEPSSWFTLSKKSGSGNDTIAITAQPNTGTSPRSAVVTVKTAGGLTREIQISQEGNVPINYLKGRGAFCSVGIASSLLPNNVSGITICTQLRLSNGTIVEASRTTLSKGGSSFLSKFLRLDSEKVPIKGEADIVGISVSCIPGTAASIAKKFPYFIGNLVQAPDPINFGIQGSSATYSARFIQSTNDTWNFELDQSIPITGDITFVYKGGSVNAPSVEIARIGY